MSAGLAPLASHQVLLLLAQLAVLLLLAVSLGRLATRIGLPSVVGELLAGLVVGPSLLGWAAPAVSRWLLPADPNQMHLLEAVGLIAVLLLVGITGVHLDMRIVRRRAGTLARVSLGGLIMPLGLGIAVGYLVPAALTGPGVGRMTFALFLGVAMCVSAIPVIAKTLMDMNLMHRDVGQLTLASATIADAVGWFLLSLVSALAVTGGGVAAIGVSALSLVGLVGFAAVVGRPAVHLAMRRAARSPEPGPITSTTVLIVLLGAAASHALGLEAVFGACLAGILVGSSTATDPSRLAPLRTVVLSTLAPLFLATVGLRVDLTALADPAVAVVGVVVLLVAVVGKIAGAYAGARLSRLGHWEALALGAGLNSRGVVEIVVATVGLRLGVLTTATYSIIVLVAIATSVMAPPMLRWAMGKVEQTADERLRAAERHAWPATPTRAASDGRIPL